MSISNTTPANSTNLVICRSNQTEHSNYLWNSSSCSTATTSTTTNDKTTSVTTLGRRYDDLFRNEKHCDCIFRIGVTSVKSHKLILSAASPVFEAMFYGPMREDTVVNILDFNPNIFYILIHYIYTGIVDFECLTLESVIELYYGAEKYLLNELVVKCLNAIKCKLRFVNILSTLELCVCMELHALQDICMNFFTRCCLTDLQYITFLKKNYFHVSKDCIKSIIKANEDFKQLIWFVYEWLQHECDQVDCKMIIDDLKKIESCHAGQAGQAGHAGLSSTNQLQTYHCNYVERRYYKACQPFVINDDQFECNTIVKCDRFITLLGIIINSRIKPSRTESMTKNNSRIRQNKYAENFCIEIYSKGVAGDYDNNESNDVRGDVLISRQTIENLETEYNCDLNIFWEDDIILTPNVEYMIKLIWAHNAYGAEYPCSLQSNEVGGVHFCDAHMQFGSIFKGLRFLNLT